ncbi:MAG TPA: hypothetical protein VIY56_05790 [Vicinamibacterales bacterium]
MDAVGQAAPQEITDPGDYCRAVERHLVQRNQGHLVRIVGPSFELVCGWAEQGVPLRVACRGIDRYVERQALKGPRRRPVRVEHCEADVLDVFDEWRRAVGAPRRSESDDDEPARQVGSLASHLERVVARLTAVASDSRHTLASLAAKADDVAQELSAAVPLARTARGEARTRLLSRLRELDAHLLDEARRYLSPEARADLRRQAETELSPFRGRMTADAYATAVDALLDRLARERYQLPLVSFD